VIAAIKNLGRSVPVDRVWSNPGHADGCKCTLCKLAKG
jgi:hypothetical protein